MSGRWMRLAVLVVLAGLPAAGMAGEQAAAPPAPEGSYVVKPGDTLWTISRDILKKPVLWRSLWQQNTFITDPNLIYPGDTLILPGPPAPPPVAAPPPPAPQLAAPEPAPPAETTAAAEPPKPEPLPVQAPAPPPAPPKAPEPPVPPASAHAIACSPSLIPEVPAHSIGLGSVIKGEDDRLLLAQNDTIFVGLGNGTAPTVGQQLAVVRLGDRLTHPGTRGVAGRVLLTLGVLEVREVLDRVLKTRLVYSCDTARLGDRVMPFAVSPLPAEPAAAPASRSVQGWVVAASRSEQLVGLQQLVFVDLGQSHGLHQGDVLGIYRPSSAVVARDATFPIPPERLGEAVVIRLTPETATAVLTASRKESRAGDRVVLSREAKP